MKLSKGNIKDIRPQPGLVIPGEKIFSLPEKVLQFGTGVLLRGLPDYFIDKANRQGIFKGRIVVVKSTGGGKADAFDQQDGLYTLCVRGIENGEKQEEAIINSSISRVISASHNWADVLTCAHDPNLQIIISNTTEVGITLSEDDIRSQPPHSFPGKLLAFLYERYKVFNGSDDSGIVIIPTELISNNASQLLAILLKLAEMNQLDEKFIKWIITSNHFCNSLVDRIVPGRLPDKDKTKVEQELGYTDELMIMAEPFRLWAIETSNEKVKSLLSFSKADDGVVIAANIEKFRVLKLRLLNAVHSFSCGLAHLAGINTVKEAMADQLFISYIHDLMMNEIVKSIVSDTITYEDACNFAKKVMDRFRNPFIEHRWLSISLQYSSKMKMRTVPLLFQYYEKVNRIPGLMALGFAGYILFMKCYTNEAGAFCGTANGKEYEIKDEHAGFFAERWKLRSKSSDEVVEAVLSDKFFWEADLMELNGFADQVKLYLRSLLEKGARKTIEEFKK